MQPSSIGGRRRHDDGPKPGLDVSLRPAIDIGSTQTFTQGDWSIDLATGLHAAADVDFTLRPPFDIDFQLPSGNVSAALGAGVRRAAASPPW